ncbi:uncharacterized protein LOC120374485 [Mauremys reevesii]|uniref:uncharacterized protein LOC120374485 n=1 Tax=Mauremys reevesii TaxID=260615 RepID=UPI00193F08CA|nr:uncharacterized protein LOC120374485 [Mauremys reevesii]
MRTLFRVFSSSIIDFARKQMSLYRRMARLLRRFRRKALQVPPEPSGRSGHLPKGQSHLSIPAGGEAAPIQARRRKFPAFWRTKPAPGAGADLGEAPTKPRWSWFRMRICGQDPAQEGRRAGRLWGLLCGQQRTQEPSPHSQQGASPCPGSEEISAPSDQEVEDPSTSTIRSAWDSSRQRQDTLEPRCCKAAVVERIVVSENPSSGSWRGERDRDVGLAGVWPG